MASVLVGDIMNSQPPRVRCGTPVSEVVRLLLQHRVPGMPVVDETDTVVGFVSEQDCIHTLLVSSYHSEGSLRVDDVMHSEPLCVPPSLSVVDLAGRMARDKPKNYPVVDNGKLVGLIYRSAVLKALMENHP